MSQSKSVSLAVGSFARSLVAGAMVSVFVAGSAAAQTHGPQPAPSPTAGAIKGQPVAVTYKQKTNYDFDDEQVEGTLVQPDTDLITGRGKSNHESMVRPRTTFQPEMLKSVESL